ncbi:MAG: HAD family acid phosphatase [Sphingomonas sp.]
MRAAATALLLAALAPTVSGCAARQAFLQRVSAKERVRHGGAPVANTGTTGLTADGATVTNLKELPPPDGSVPATALGAAASDPAAAVAAPGSGASPAMQFLYGSGEAAALDYQAYLGLIDLMIAKSSDRAVGQKVLSVVLTPAATLTAPKFASCEGKPLAAVFDVDETALLNVGFEADDAQHPGRPYDQARWERWERSGQNAVVATPGMIEVARVAKASGVTLVFNTNRQTANAAATVVALDRAGLGPIEHGNNLWLQGDEGTGAGKDSRRTAIAAKYCVIAMAGDQLGDFSDLFNTPGRSPAARRALATGNTIKTMWGHGWFILPNPVYGTALKGAVDDIFPAEKRWNDPLPTGAK